MMNSTPVKQNPFLFYLHLLLYMILALLIRALAFAPLLCLAAFPAGAWQRCLALLCPALVVLAVLPLRFSFAEALVQKPGERRFDLNAAFSFRDYGEKLSESVLHAFHVAKWGLPLFAMLGYACYVYNEVDALTLLQSVTAIGKTCSTAWCAVASAIGGLFGAEPLVPASNTLMDGVVVLCAILGLGVLIWLFGAVRNSATRYIWVLANRGDRPLRTEMRRRLIGRRFRQWCVGFVNFALCVPFLAVTLATLKGALTGLSNQLMASVMQGGLPAIPLASVALPLVLCFVGLYLPLLPVRRWLTASFAVRERRSVAGGKAA